jgi:hypothetical protein
VFPVKVSLAACSFRDDQARERLVVSDQSHAITCGGFDDFKSADPDHTNGAYTKERRTNETHIHELKTQLWASRQRLA